MRASEAFGLLLFLTTVSGTFVLATGLAIRLTSRWVLGQPLIQHTWEPWTCRVLFSLAALGALCIAYGYWVEPYWLSVSHVRISSPKIPPTARPIRVAHISDIHSDPRPRLEERLPQAIANLKPDLIVFTGDALNSPEGLPVFKHCMRRLAEIAPVYAVKGNMDIWYWSGLDLYGGTGVRELKDEALHTRVGGTRVRLIGVPADREQAIPRLLDSPPRDALTILLHHYPDEIEVASQYGADLYLAGHTHGGQVALPVYGAILTLSRFGKRYEAGLYRVKDTWLYVNRGIGMEGGKAPRVRFCARPEITLIEVGSR